MATNRKKRKPANPFEKTLRYAGTAIGFFMRALMTVFLVFVITGCILAVSITIYVMNFMETDNDINLDNVSLSYTTMFYAEDEAEGWKEIYRVSGDQKRIEVSIKEIPQIIQDCFTYTEDKRFNEHEGVDWIRTIKVSFDRIFSDGTQGGSTITQQLIKNITKDDDVTPVRKLREIFRALELERNYSKSEILEGYLNVVFLGERNYGIEAASQAYFGCSAKDLTVPQACSLAGMLRSPNAYRPDLHPDKNKERRDYALGELLENEIITEAEYNRYINTPVTTVKSQSQDQTTTDESTKNSGVTSYFVDAVYEDAIEALMAEFNWSRDYATHQLKNGGYRIYTTVDLELQDYLEDKFADWTTFSKEEIPLNEDGKLPEAAMVIMDYEGHLLALAGGKGEKTANLTYNRATMAARPSGSSIKPIAVYAPALEYDLINWSTVLVDSPAMKLKAPGADPDDEGRDWPNNYSGKYGGDTTIVKAVRESLNTIPVKLILQLSTQRSIEFMEKKFGISSLVKNGTNNDYGPSLALGSLTDGLYLTELTASYAPFGNGGTYYEPVTFTRIEDASGALVIDNTPEKTRALSEDTASVMNRLLHQVIYGPSGTGKEARIGDMPVIGKTGTSQDYKDLTFVGMTPYYLAGVWTGYDAPEELPWRKMYDPDTIWKNVMGPLHENLEVKDFTLSENVVQVEYCIYTGMAAAAGCEEAEMGYYKANAMPEPCDGFHEVNTGDTYNNKDKEKPTTEEDVSSEPIRGEVIIGVTPPAPPSVSRPGDGEDTSSSMYDRPMGEPQPDDTPSGELAGE